MPLYLRLLFTPSPSLWTTQPFLIGLPPAFPTLACSHSCQSHPIMGGSKGLSGSSQWAGMAQLDSPGQLETPTRLGRNSRRNCTGNITSLPWKLWVRGGSLRNKPRSQKDSLGWGLWGVFPEDKLPLAGWLPRRPQGLHSSRKRRADPSVTSGSFSKQQVRPGALLSLCCGLSSWYPIPQTYHCHLCPLPHPLTLPGPLILSSRSHPPFLTLPVPL